MWFIPKGTTPAAIERAAEVDDKTGIGNILRTKAQEIANTWKNQDTDTRYGGYRIAAENALEKVNAFLRTAGISTLTLDGVDSGTQGMTMPNATDAFKAAVDQFYRQRGWYMGKYVHNSIRDYYNIPANRIAGLSYHEIGPDFSYTTDGGKTFTYFEILTGTKKSLQKHVERHGAYLWRAVFYTFNGPDVSDIP
ncbi:MAG: hypothetical protein K8T89_12415 [Planctomycetes bacterium]|nr:hypothetical protein [Planctomycetota bacterium]